MQGERSRFARRHHKLQCDGVPIAIGRGAAGDSANGVEHRQQRAHLGAVDRPRIHRAVCLSRNLEAPCVAVSDDGLHGLAVGADSNLCNVAWSKGEQRLTLVGAGLRGGRRRPQQRPSQSTEQRGEKHRNEYACL
jgi:hypothetical protein